MVELSGAVSSVSIVQKGAAAAPGVASDVPADSPLETNIGMGLDVYASGLKNVVMPVCAMDVPVKAATVNGIDIMAPKNTKVTGLGVTNASYSYTKLYTQTADQMSDQLAISAGIKGTAGAFKGSLEGSFSTKVTDDVTQLFTLMETILQRYQITLTTWSFTDPFTQALKNLEGKTWAHDASSFETFFQDYGTHVVTGIIMGAKLSACIVTTTESHVTTTDITADLKAAYGPISGEASGKGGSTNSLVMEYTDETVSAHGGDTTAASQVIVSGAFNNGNYQSWLGSIQASDWPLTMDEIAYTLSPINSHLPSTVSASLKSQLDAAFTAYCKAQAAQAGLPNGKPVTVSVQLLQMNVINDADSLTPGEFFWDFSIKNDKGTTIGTLSSVARDAYAGGLTDGTQWSFDTLIKLAQERAGKNAAKDVAGTGAVSLQFYPDDPSASFTVLGTLTERDQGSSNDTFNPYSSANPPPVDSLPVSASTKLVFDAAHFYGATDKSGKARTYTMDFHGSNKGPGHVEVTYQISFSPAMS